MWVAASMMGLGLVLLAGGGEALVRGAVGLATLARVSATVIGLTVVAAGTSMPELVVSLEAATYGKTDLAVGNVVGSNIFNIVVILGIASLIAPLRVVGNIVRLEYPVMLLASIQLFLLSRDGRIDRLEGGFLVMCLVAFVAYAVWTATSATTRRERAEFEQAVKHTATRTASWWRHTLLVAVGIGSLMVGSNVLVVGAVAFGQALGVPETIIGLTVVAAGTSLPELAASCVASVRGNHDIAVANVVGSNIFNVLAIAGTTALIHPLPVPEPILERDMWWMIGASILLLPIIKSGLRVSRFEGAVLIGGFAAYLVVLFRA